jgi:flagellar FliL protein
MKASIFTLALRFVLPLFVLATSPVFASEHGSSAPAGPAPLQFTVNVGDSVATMRVLQVTMVFEFATPESSVLIAERKPKVQHQIILLLTGEDIASLQTVKGKQELQEKIIKDLNGLIKGTVETGIKEVFFTSFIMQ